MRYRIADISVEIPDGMVCGHFAEALTPFRAESYGDAAELSLLHGNCPPPMADYTELDNFDFADADADCRFGRDAEGYILEMSPRSGAAPARFRKPFEGNTATTDFTTGHDPALLRFGLWTMFNISALERGRVAFHSSVISYRGRSVLFLGESGTGKSTHTRMWRESISGARLLNDDSPIVAIADNGIVVNGSPWSGKTPCYRNVTEPVAAIVRLSQAPHNRIRRLRPIEALGAVLPSLPPAFAHDESLQELNYRIVDVLLRSVPVYHLECLPDHEAAKLSCNTIFAE